MKRLYISAGSACLLLALSTPSLADPGGRGHGHGRHPHAQERGPSLGPLGQRYIEEYLDGLCVVERQWEKNGRYKEQRKCPGSMAQAPRYGVRYAASATVLPALPTIVVQPPVLVVQP